MAQGGIKKGFFFYFGLFVLLLISVFCICLVVMMFNPGSTVLWMQYFSGNEVVHVVETTGEAKTDIPWTSLSAVNISCSYADVVIERNSDSSIQKYSKRGYDQNGIYIVNNAKGFTTAASATKFSYDATLNGGTLNIDIHEPTGFLYFSKQVKVVLHSTTQEILTNDTTWDFSDLDITVTTKDGNVDIGGPKANIPKEIKPKSLDVKTTNGNISFSEMTDMSNLSELELTTENGTLNSAREVNSGSATGKGVKLNCDAAFIVNGRGKILYNVIEAPNSTITLTCKAGSWDIGRISTNKTICVDCENGNYLFDEVNGELDFSYSKDTLVSPNILIKKIGSDFSLFAGNAGSHPDIEIGESQGKVSVHVDRGSLKIKKAHGTLDVDSNNDLKVDVVFDEHAEGLAAISDKKGSIRLGFLEDVFEDPSTQVAGVHIVTESGNVVIDITEKAKFVANMYLNKADVLKNTPLDEKNITVNIGNTNIVEGTTKNPLTVNKNATENVSGRNGTIEILTTGKVTFNLKSAESLTA